MEVSDDRLCVGYNGREIMIELGVGDREEILIDGVPILAG